MRPSPEPLPIAAWWMERTASGEIQAERWPAPSRLAPAPRLLLVNDLPLALEAAALPASERNIALDLRDVFALVRPLSPADAAPDMLGVLAGDGIARSGAQALADAWPTVERGFQAWPDALRETVAQLLAAASPAWRALAALLAAETSFALNPEALSASQSLLALVAPQREKLMKRKLPDPSTIEPLDPEAVAALLEPDGAFAQAFEGYEHREGQLQMVRAVADAFNSHRHLLVEAGTGVGKSVAYLLPAILWALRNQVPVVVSTSTKNLQSQLFEKDLPMLRRVLRQPFRAALIKGRMNYVCLRHVLHLLDQREAELNEEELVPMAKVLAWLVVTPTGDLDELDRVFADDGFSLRARLPANGEECGGRRCGLFGRCLLQKARLLSLNADIVVANHALVFAEDDEQPTAIPRHAQLVFDEAHNLEESATRHFSVEVSPARFAILLRRLWRGSARQRGGGLLESLRGVLHTNPAGLSDRELDETFAEVTAATLAAERLRKTAHAYFAALADVPRSGEAPLRFQTADLASPRWRAVARPQKAVLEDLGALQERLESILRRIALPEEDPAAPPRIVDLWRDLQAAQLGAAELAADFAFVTRADDREYVYWLALHLREREPAGLLTAAPVEIAARLVEQVFDRRDSVVLSSATLSVNGSFQFLAHRLGLDRLEPDRLQTCQAASPFDYTRQCQVAAATFLPDPADATGVPYPEALADFLVALLQRTRGRTLVLFTSYEMLRTCGRILAAPLRTAGIPLLLQGEGGSRERLTRTFRNDISSVLLGTDSFWEGVDVMGESLSCVVIARLPFDAVKDPLVCARGERIAEQGGDPFRHFTLPSAVIRFRQGFGRLIRHREDRGVVLVADRRIFSKGYGLHFRRNLPCPIRNCAQPAELLDDTERFLA